jgi:hypothetical protein
MKQVHWVIGAVGLIFCKFGLSIPAQAALVPPTFIDSVAALARIMHQAERFCTSGRRSCGCDPSVWIGVRQLGVQRV